jgi:hypothetical protein
MQKNLFRIKGIMENCQQCKYSMKEEKNRNHFSDGGIRKGEKGVNPIAMKSK